MSPRHWECYLDLDKLLQSKIAHVNYIGTIYYYYYYYYNKRTNKGTTQVTKRTSRIIDYEVQTDKTIAFSSGGRM